MSNPHHSGSRMAQSGTVIPGAISHSRTNFFRRRPAVVLAFCLALLPAHAAVLTNSAPRPRFDLHEEELKFHALRLQDENGKIPPNAMVDAVQQAQQMPYDPRPWPGQASASSGGSTPLLRTAGVETNSWIWMGPGNIGGRIRSILVHPTVPNTLWVGGVAGGVWKTVDGGASWVPLNDFMANLAVACLVMDPSNPNVIYAGTGEGFSNADSVRGAGIFKTTDGGTTWSQLSATANSNFYYVNRLAVCPTNNLILLAATGSGIWRSANGGGSWTQVYSGGAIGDVDFNPAGSAAVAGGKYGVILYSLNVGQTWSSASGITSSARIEVAYAASNPSLVYASVNNNSGEIYLSSDGGQTYSYVSNPQHLGAQGWYDNALWVDPTNPNLVVVGGIDLYRSTDGGGTFTKISQWYSAPSSAHADHHCIMQSSAYDGVNNKTVFFGNDGGIYKAADVTTVALTSGWTFLNNNLGITQFYGAAGNNTSGTVVGGTQDNGTLRKTGPGSTGSWSAMFGGDGGFCAADQSDTNYFYGEYVYLQIHRSSNGGASSSYITTGLGDAGLPNSNGVFEAFLPPDGKTDGADPDGTGPGGDPDSSANFIAPFILDPNNPSTMLAGGSNLWRTINVKASPPTWVNIKPGANGAFISAIAVAPGNSDIIWVGHNNGDVYSTVNGTAASPTWNRQDLGSPNLPNRQCTRLTIDPNNSSIVYATFGGFNSDNVYRTSNGGSTWQNISSGLPAAPVNTLAIAPFNSSYLYVGMEVGVFASADGGTTWSTGNLGAANVAVDELFWMNNYLVAATHGRGLFKALVSLNPLIALSGATLGSENCPPGNGVMDPGETVTVSFSLTNQASVAATNLVATLLPGGGVSNPGPAQNYGSLIAGGAAVARSFSLTATGACGGTLTATLQLNDGTNNLGTVNAVFPLGVAAVTTENFDGVTAPALPSGWTVGWSGSGSAWTTVTGTKATAPNSAFVADPGAISDNQLTSPSLMIHTTNAVLSFDHYYNTESGYDGCALEMAINGGSFQDILAAGGSFAGNGYNQTIPTTYGNPLGGRQAWSGSSGSFLKTTVNLPASVAGQSVQFRWRLGSDSSVSSLGWYVDDVLLTDGYSCCSGIPPVFKSITRTNNTVCLIWSLVPNTTNRVQYCTNLASGVWYDLPGDVITNGAVATRIDTGVADVQRFYRIQVR